MLSSFTFELPRGIVFGPETYRQLSAMVDSLGSRLLLLTGSSWFDRSGWKKKIYDLLRQATLNQICCHPGEPTASGVNQKLEEARTFKPDAIVAIGGGSVLDTAKVISCLLPQPKEERVEDYLEGIGTGKTLSSPGIPWVAVPTTAGTGTEVTKNAVIRSTVKKAKKSIRSSFLIATHAIIDPLFTLDLPLNMTGLSGMDALTQLIESFISIKSKIMTRALVKDAFPRMLKALKEVTSQPDNLDLRTEISYGSMISGIALANSGLGAAHGFASGLGGLYEIPHGLICASFLAPVISFNAAAVEQRLSELAGPNINRDVVDYLIGEIEELLRLFKLEKAIRNYGIAEDNLAEIAEASQGSSMSGNPVPLSRLDKEKLLRRVLVD